VPTPAETCLERSAWWRSSRPSRASSGCRFAAGKRAVEAAVGLLCAFGVVMGVAMAPTLVQYVHADPGAIWQAAGATALFIAGFGAVGYGTRRDLTAIARVSSWGLVGLIVLGIVLLVLQVPGGALIYSILSLILFAALTMYDFQRLQRLDDGLTAPLLAASIFLDILNVFLSFLQLLYNPHED
jgi:FtsH-binding integral membrane protein